MWFENYRAKFVTSIDYFIIVINKFTSLKICNSFLDINAKKKSVELSVTSVSS